jgi:hypothetical protein
MTNEFLGFSFGEVNSKLYDEFLLLRIYTTSTLKQQILNV